MSPIPADCGPGGGGVVGDPCCPATNNILASILAAVADLDGNTDTLETLLATLGACCADGNVTLTAILTAVADLDSNTDTIEALLNAILDAVADLDVNTDGLEQCCADGNVILAAILAAVDGLEGNTDTIEALLTAISTAVADLDVNTDGIEALLTTIVGHVDGLEACCASSNVILTAILAAVDGLEGFTDGIEALLTTISTNSTTIAGATHAEDAPHASGDLGQFALAVRNDADAVRTSADGDYSPISVDSAGRVKGQPDKAEDAAHTSGDIGSFALGVRNDADAVRTSADGDYSPLSTDSTGRLKTSVGALPGSLTGVAEDSAAANGQVGLPVLGVRNDTSSVQTSTDGDYGFISIDSAGRPKVNVDTEVASAFTHGQNLDIDSGADEQIVVASNPAKHGVLVKAMPDNTGILYIGLVGVTSATGFPLEAGENVTIVVDDANKIYARASIDNQALAWMAS